MWVWGVVRLVTLLCDMWNGDPDSDSGATQQHHWGREQQLWPHWIAIMHCFGETVPNMLVKNHQIRFRKWEREREMSSFCFTVNHHHVVSMMQTAVLLSLAWSTMSEKTLATVPQRESVRSWSALVLVLEVAASAVRSKRRSAITGRCSVLEKTIFRRDASSCQRSVNVAPKTVHWHHSENFRALLN